MHLLTDLRQATDAEVHEALERNPGSARLAEKGWTPLWFELRLFRDAERTDEVEHVFSVVWKAPEATAEAVAEEETEAALDELLRNLSDFEGLDVDPEDVERELRLDPAL